VLEPHRYEQKDAEMPYTEAQLAAYEKIRGRKAAARFALGLLIGAVLIACKLADILDLTWTWTTSPIWFTTAGFLLSVLDVAGVRAANDKAQKP
jgi:hypothetical protein